MTTVYISMGSNIRPRATYLRKGINALKISNIRIKRLSSVYQTSPVSLKTQPHFLNAVLKAETTLSPEALLLLFKQIEKSLGRVGGKRFGPRTLDLDLLRYGNLRLNTKTLTVPHPRMTRRKFVLVPLLEINPKLKNLEGLPYATFLRKIGSHQRIKRTSARL